MIFRLKVIVARASRGLTRMLGRGGGTTLPGRILLKLEPRALARLAGRLTEGAVLVSATNGKTTTASMISAALDASGKVVVHNRAGSNMSWGVVTALLDSTPGEGALGLFEVDEAWLVPVADAVHPRVIVLCNLFRDQLDRYGELDTLADRWRALVARGQSSFVLNADDPLVADLGRDRSDVLFYGVEDSTHALPGLQHAADSKHCLKCGAAYVYDVVLLGHLGHYHCPSCGRSRPRPVVTATAVVLDGMRGSRLEMATPAGRVAVDLPLPGLYNVYNALAATAVAVALGVPPSAIESGLGEVAAAFGRVERLAVAEREVAILLVKNPTGANEVLRTLNLDEGPHDLWIALNDGIADGRDISWIWDADFEVLRDRVGRVTCSGTRAEEMALRLKYAGLEVVPDVDRDIAASFDRAVGEGSGPLYALPTYTALLELRSLLADRGLARAWSE